MSAVRRKPHKRLRGLEEIIRSGKAPGAVIVNPAGKPKGERDARVQSR